jgi:hypothetical protein
MEMPGFVFVMNHRNAPPEFCEILATNRARLLCLFDVERPQGQGCVHTYVAVLDRPQRGRYGQVCAYVLAELAYAGADLTYRGAGWEAETLVRTTCEESGIVPLTVAERPDLSPEMRAAREAFLQRPLNNAYIGNQWAGDLFVRLTALFDQANGGG